MTQFLLNVKDIKFSDSSVVQQDNEYSFLFHNQLSGTENCYFNSSGIKIVIPNYRSDDTFIYKISGIKF